ncbi:ABC transporter permease [Companilactobacillus sp. HBUAS56275]|uniref:ABC transporter permease n=1 Tax=Candidatus Companilactobacillus pullicola TaxID=2838523 RepID=A0A9D2CPV9_9LACO|nr:ABC transporter permease [Candidatus Companilactobacillus pullicola]
MNLIVSTISQGFIWSIMAIGLFITFRILDFPDMTVEGSFPLGAVTAISLIQAGHSTLFALLMAFIFGCFAGFATAFLYAKLNVPILLAGILTMTALYSINLRILGKANMSLTKSNNIFTEFGLDKLPTNFNGIVLGIIIIAIIIFLLIIFLNTEKGQAVIATGDNETMAASLGINTTVMKFIGLMVSNGIVALTGGLIAQQNGFADVNMGIGVIVIGLSAIIIGEVIYPDVPLSIRLITIVIGSIAYRLILMVVLQLGFNTNDLKLISAIILALCLALPTIREQFLKTLRNGVKTK